MNINHNYNTNYPASFGNFNGNMPEETPKISFEEVKDTFEKEKKKNGVFQKGYDWLKNLTGFGTGSKKVEQILQKCQNGEISEEQAKEEISKYKNSQKNSEQTFGDLIAGLVGVSTFVTINNKLKYVRSKAVVGNKTIDLFNNVFKGLKSKKLAILAVPIAAIAAGVSKMWALKLNRATSEEFKVSDEDKENLSKKELKEKKKELKKARKKENAKNFLTGAVSGLMSPIVSVLGAFTAPFILAGQTALRYFTIKDDSSQKSWNDFVEKFKDNAVFNTIAAVALLVPVAIKGHNSSVLNKNLSKVTENLQKANLQNKYSGETAYDNIVNKLLNSETIKNIIDDSKHLDLDLDLDDQIKKLTEENLFAVKFLQIKDYGKISTKLKENCPSSRTLEEAKSIIQNQFGDKYEMQRLAGVGTVAESYFVKDKEGKEYCIKLLKKGINKSKINNDAEKFKQIINSDTSLTQDQKDYYLKNIENLKQGLLQEVDFKHEKEAAEKLANYTKTANVVKPVEISNDGTCYVMEKAKGISLQEFLNKPSFNDLEPEVIKELNDIPNESIDAKITEFNKELEKCRDNLKKPKDRTESETKFIDETNNKIYLIERKIEFLQAKKHNSNFAKLAKLDHSDCMKLLDQYSQILVEQFTKVEKDGKTLHADIHPGNIFIDLDSLKSGNGKFFTLIDTGNTIDLTQDQTLRSLQLTSMLKNADVENLTDFILDKAILPETLTKEQARAKVLEDIKNAFFDKETYLCEMTQDNFLSMANKILEKHNILPNDSQLNLNKAKQSAASSYRKLSKTFVNYMINNFEKQATTNKSKLEAGKLLAETTLNTGKPFLKYQQAVKTQEQKNLKQLSRSERIKFKKMQKGALDKKSEEYLTFKLKQGMQTAEEKKHNINFIQDM